MTKYNIYDKIKIENSSYLKSAELTQKGSML